MSCVSWIFWVNQKGLIVWYWASTSAVKSPSDIEFCDSVSSSLDRYIGSVCIGSSCSFKSWVVRSAILLVFKYWRAVVMNVSVVVEKLESCGKLDASLRFGLNETRLSWEKEKSLEDLLKFRRFVEQRHLLLIWRASKII